MEELKIARPETIETGITGEDSAESLVEVTKKLKKRAANQRITIHDDDGDYYMSVRIKNKWFRVALTEV